MTDRRLRRVVVVAAVTVTAVGGLGLAGCRGDDATRPSSRTTETSTATGTGAAAYVGLSKRAAIAKAEASDTPWRITREDDESFLVTQDYVADRLNFEIDDGTVTEATLG